MRIEIATALVALIVGSANAAPLPASVDTCFTPAEACAERIVSAINHATSDVHVEAYSFTSHPILDAIEAAHTRGVHVAIILDHSDAKHLCDHAPSGIPIWIDHPHGIAHNKLIIIDRHLIIGGSYNYSASAEHRNVENVTFIDSEPIAARFLSNWTSRQRQAEPFPACPN
jgi:phospholipase D